MIELLKKIDQEGIVIELIEGELKLFSPQTSIDGSLLLDIKTHKKELTDFLSKNSNSKIEERKHYEIPTCGKSESYRLSNSQYGLWAASQVKENSIAYNLSSQLLLNGDYDIDCFQKAIYAVIDRHEILRTVFKSNKNQEVQQYVLTTEELGFKIDYKNFCGSDNPERTSKDYISSQLYKPFDLEEGPLIRASLLQIAKDKYIFYYSMHHIISDAWSMKVLSQDVLTYYEAYASNKVPDISPLKIQYKDFAVWQLSELESPLFQEHKDYWLSQLSGDIPEINLPIQKRRPQVKTYKGQRFGARISPSVTSQLQSFVKRNGGSLFMGMLTVMKVLLYRYTGEKDIVIGNPTAGRNHADLEDQIGFYINTMALRNQVVPDYSFIEFYNSIKASTFESYAHQMYPFDELLEGLNLQRDISRSPLFDVLIDYEGASETGMIFKNDDEIVNLGTGLVKYDLEVDFMEVAEGIDIKIGYNTDVYERKMIEGFIDHFKILLEGFLRNTEACIGTVDFLSEEERKELLIEFNASQINYPQEQNILDLFAAQVKKRPNETALIFENDSLTYRELDERSNQLARYLKEQGVEKDSLVPIYLERSMDMIVGVLGIIKSGGAYVPIDLNCPAQRLSFILEDTNCKWMLSHSDLTDTLEEYEDDLNLIYIDKLEENYSEFSKLPLDIIIQQDQLAYVIYTSGTTGVPKGVLIEHKSIANYISHQSKYFDVDEKDAFILFASIAFDASIEQMFLAISNGAKLVIPQKSDLLDSEKFARLLSTHKVTHLHAVPSFLRTIEFDTSFSLKRIISAGESFDIEVFREWENKVEVYNKYGPTETTISVAEYKVTDENYNYLSIGKPIAKAQCYILGEENKLQPQGVIGEICIGGPGLARGYLNRPELTKEQFIEHPYVKGKRLYKTGDLGSWLPDGSIAFHGRKDHQVKIRGYRIELGEIESVLNSLYNIEQAVVLAIDDSSGLKQLVAYIVSDELVDSNSVKEGLMLLLEEKLPEYMVPNLYIKMDELPLTTNGKINRKALPVPNTLSRQKEYVAPTTNLEIQLAEIWQNILGVEKIGIHDDFFELGGNSLNAIKINFLIKKNLNFDIEIKSFFLFKSIGELTAQIEFSETQKAIKNNQQTLKKIEL